MIDMHFRNDLQVYGPEDAAELPEISLSFRLVDRGIRGSLADPYFQQIAAFLNQGGNIVFEPVVAALVDSSGGSSVIFR